MTFRRKTIPPWIKKLVVKRQSKLCACGCGEKVDVVGAHFDHDPPLRLRPLNEAGTDTIPAQNDPDYLFALVPKHHAIKTYCPRGPHTSIDSDRHSIDKTKRIEKGGRKRRGPPMAGCRDSSTKHHMNGVVSWRQKASTMSGETKEFPIGAVLTVLTGTVVAADGIGGVYQVLNWMTGENVYTHQLPRIANEARPALLAAHPQLEVTIEEAKSVNRENWQQWLETWTDRYGPLIAVPKLTEDQHERIDPLSELAEKVHPSKIIVVDTKGASNG